MNSTVQHRVLNNYSIGLLSFIITLLQSIVSVPILLEFWGNDIYGVWLALFAGFTILQTIDFGHQSYIGNLLNIEYHINKEKFSVYLGSSLLIGIILGFIQLGFTILLIKTNYLSVFLGISMLKSNYSVISLSLLILMLMWIMTGSVGGILVKILIPAGFMPQSLVWGIIFKLAQFLSLILVAINGGFILEASLVYSIIQLVLSFLAFWYIKIKLPEFYPWWKLRDIKTGFINLRKSSILTVNNAFQQFSNSGIILFITNFFSTSIVPAFTTVRTLTNTAAVFTNLFITSIQPDLIKYHAKQETGKLNSTLNANWFFSGLFVNIGLIVLIPFAEDIFNLWTKGLVLFDFKLFIFLAASISVINFGAGLYNYLYGINHLKSISLITASRFIIIFSFSFLFAPQLGLSGVGLSILCSEIVASLILPVLFVNKLLKSLHSFIDKKNLTLALTAPLVMAILAISTLITSELIKIIYLPALLLIILVYIFNWLILEKDVKIRFYDLLNNFKNRRK